MLKLTKKSDYGLIAMKHLAEQASRGACSAKDLAEAYGLPQQALAKILQRLARAKLVAPQRGTNGGYTLGRDAGSITAFEVIQAIEGPLFMTSCAAVRGACDQSGRCTVREPLQQVRRGIEEVLNHITISQMGRERTAEAKLDQGLTRIESRKESTAEPRRAEDSRPPAARIGGNESRELPDRYWTKHE
jgi:Rrf2 family protein